MHEDNKRMAASNSRENRMSRDPMTSSHQQEHDTGETAGISGLTELLCMETMMKPQAHTLSATMRVSKGRMGTHDEPGPRPDTETGTGQTTRAGRNLKLPTRLQDYIL